MTETSSDQPHIVADLGQLMAGLSVSDSGAVWRLEDQQRQLDANLVRLPAGRRVDLHRGPDEDVLLQVVAGSGELTTEYGLLQLKQGLVVWLPRRSFRALAAGPDGLTYLSVHRRRAGVIVSPKPDEGSPVERLIRWELFGGAWRVVERSADEVTVSLCRCDGGEELDRLNSHDSRLLDWLAERDASTD